MIERSQVDTTDAELARDVLDEAYGSTLRLTGDLGHVSFGRTDARAFSVDTVVLDATLSYDSDPMGGFTVLEGLSGWSEYTRRGVTDEAARGDVVLVSGRDEAYAGRSQGVAVRGVTLPWSLLDDVARDVRGEDCARSPRFHAYKPTTAVAAAHWRGLCDYVESALAPERGPVSNVVVESLARLLGHAALTTFPNDVVEVSAVVAAQARRDGTPASVRRAVAHIEAQADDSLTVSAIAAAAHVSPRALQIAFRRHLGTTPMAYARRVRLDHARRDLLASDPDRETVSAVAVRWGFHNHGRFAAEYRAAYGENPSDTLDR